jgi:hypothetical protein
MSGGPLVDNRGHDDAKLIHLTLFPWNVITLTTVPEPAIEFQRD